MYIVAIALVEDDIELCMERFAYTLLRDCSVEDDGGCA